MLSCWLIIPDIAESAFASVGSGFKARDICAWRICIHCAMQRRVCAALAATAYTALCLRQSDDCKSRPTQPQAVNRGHTFIHMPSGVGPTNTIMRAELIAIYAVLHHASTLTAECTIATDSKAAMHAIHKQIHNPRGNQYNTHRELLRPIASALLHRAQTGLRTDIIKVKSHIGIEGNEVADKLANAARDPSACDVSDDIGNLAHQGEHWPMLIAHPRKVIKQPEDRMASNLQASLMKRNETVTPIGVKIGVLRHQPQDLPL